MNQSEFKPALSIVFANAVRAIEGVLNGKSVEAVMATLPLQDFEPRTRAALRDYVNGTLREWRKLQVLVHWSADRTTFAPPVLEIILAVGIYALRQTRIPQHTVVSECVNMSEKVAGGRVRGMVNAVLRGYLRRRSELDARLAHEPAEVQYSYPDWWVARLQVDWPYDWESILEVGNGAAPMALRVNAKRLQAKAWLAEAGVAGVVFDDYGIKLAAPIKAAGLAGFAQGNVSIQDAGAQLCAAALGARDGMRVLDACSAPGNKACAILERADVALTALDQDATRQATTQENFHRLGLKADVRVGDAGDTTRWWDGVYFDRILIDAPCTASGVIRRHPDGKWLKRATDLRALVAEQRRILDALWPTLKLGGKLLYVTCSVFRDENSRQIEAFLSRHTDAVQESVVWPAGIDAREGSQLLPGGAPDTHNHDGFFCVSLIKT